MTPKTYIDALISRLLAARVEYTCRQCLIHLPPLSWPVPRPAFQDIPDIAVPLTPEKEKQKSEVLNSFVTSVIMNIVLTDTDMNIEDEEAGLESATVLLRKLLKIPGASNSMKTRTVNTRKFIIKQMKDLV